MWEVGDTRPLVSLDTVTPPEWKVLRDPLLERARRDSDRLAYSFCGERVTFGELGDRAAIRASTLERHGVDHGDRVALVMSAGLPLIETFWAAQLIGAVPCIINPAAPARAVRTRTDSVRPSIVVTDESAAEMSHGDGLLIVPDLSAHDLAFLQLTSGTSGEPRPAMIPHRAVMAYLNAKTIDGHLTDGDVLVNWMPPWHDFGLVCFVIAAVYFGTPSHLLEPKISALPRWLSLIGEVGGTYTGAPDFAYRVALRVADPRRVDLSSLRIAQNGAEPVQWSTIEQFEARFSSPGVVMPSYGLAEATVGVAAHLPGDERVVDARGNVSCGRPITGIEVRAGSDADSADEICLRGRWVFDGYFDGESDTREKLVDGWLHTGDTGYVDAEGRLFVLGRRTSMIKRAGGVVAPRELEEAAHLVAGVRSAAATSVPGRRGDDQIVVVVERRDPAIGHLSRDVSQAVVESLGFAPNRVVVVEPRTIPRSETGKIRYGVLRDAVRDGTIS
jgi:fatty-acyl-CoA synthase